MAKIAVLLSGSGVYDGAEINEAVLTLLHLEKAGACYQCFAPDITQMHTIDHTKGEPSSEARNVLVESARIARGNVQALNQLDAANFDALVLPGGFGVAKNFCDFAVKGAEMTVHEGILSVCKAFATAKKPAGYMCIAPVLLPEVYGQGVQCTVGNDAEVAKAIEAMGGVHLNCAVDAVVTDTENKVVTTPAYMLAQNLCEAEAGIQKLVQQVITWVK
ncbi:isoprenoid biosynthesis glyoxalase ElbB [Aliidiomarina celeris]|uniref:isoprenoid biosynthesis glyoxalase ElbB n=1 Tax=Aliidiomarina celeris TaxID=2249428 RepID=UPI000DEAB324|nr:isoprenoid biosynthesis glyoxalase ElbB [Aliidiomarina celeris]